MNNLKRFFPVLIALLLFNPSAFAQTQITGTQLSKLQTWQLLDYNEDSAYGASVNKAYKELLKGKKSHPVIVAILDGDVDITHKDLQGHIWTNKKEIPGNGIDDDKNGYVDDVNGWNFLGGKDGKMMDATSSEADREYFRLLPEYGQIKDSSRRSNNKEYQYFLRAKTKHLEDSVDRSRDNLSLESDYVRQLADADSFLQKAIHQQLIYYKDVESFQPKDSLAEATKKLVINFYNYSDRKDKSTSLDSYVSELINDPNELRKEIVGDNPFDINDRNYGNNIVGDECADHGTHCSGIISAIRDNGIGMDGIADDVLIMPVRAVSSLQYGDEMDTDIALGIVMR